MRRVLRHDKRNPSEQLNVALAKYANLDRFEELAQVIRYIPRIMGSMLQDES